MNTLGKQTTKRFYKTETGFEAIQQAWRQLLETGYQPSTYDLLSYAILRGKDYRKGFTPITNEIKLANGQVVLGSLRNSLAKIRRCGASPIFNEFIIEETHSILKTILPSVGWNLSSLDTAYLETVNV